MLKSFSLILETENLGMAGLADLEASLDSLKKQKYSVKNVKEVLVVVGSHVSEDVQDLIKKKYPWVKLNIEKEILNYTKAKMRGAETAKGDVVIFADSDMRYQNIWLGNMINVFSKYPSGYIMSGDTRLETNSSYKMSLNCTWMVQILSDKIKKPVPTSYFPLNNFAIERKVLLRMPIPYDLPLYRNKISVWEKILVKNGYKILRVPGTRAFHAPPGTLVDWWYRLLIYGSDFVSMADFSINKKGKIVEKKNMRGRLFNLVFLFPWKIEQLVFNTYKLLREDGGRIKYLPASLLLGIINCVVVELGALVAFFNRDFIFKKINAHEAKHSV